MSSQITMYEEGINGSGGFQVFCRDGAIRGIMLEDDLQIVMEDCYIPFRTSDWFIWFGARTMRYIRLNYDPMILQPDEEYWKSLVAEVVEAAKRMTTVEQVYLDANNYYCGRHIPKIHGVHMRDINQGRPLYDRGLTIKRKW